MTTTNNYFRLDPLKLKRRSSMNRASSQNHNFHLYQNYQNGVVIYRNAKYSGLFHRSFIYLQTYFHFTVIQHWIPIVKRCHEFLSSQLLGLCYLLVFTPIHIFIALGLLLWRNIRIYLVNKYHPEAVLCETFSPHSKGVITSVIWLRGKVDVQKLYAIFSHSLTISSHSNLSHSSVESRLCKLKMKLASSFGLHIFLPLDKREFNIKNHIEEAPKELLKYFVINDIFQEEKSTLEKFVSQCASEKLDKELSPWKITVIPQSIFNKEKTCCVLRFHSTLLEDPSVSKILDNLFHQNVYPDLDSAPNIDIQSNYNKSSNYNNNLLLHFSHPFLHGSTEKKIQDGIDNSHYALENDSEKQRNIYENDNYNVYDEENNQNYHYYQEQQLRFQDPKDILTFFTKNKFHQLCKWCHHNLYFSSSDITTWINLQKKQFEFHGKFYLLNAIACELMIFCKRLFWLVKSIQPCFHQQLKELKPMLKLLVVVIRAVIYVPAEILSTLVHTNSTSSCSYTNTRIKRMSGFQRMKEEQMRRIAWTAPISTDLIENIKDITGASTSSIILTACSLALNDFYCENNLPNPKNLGVMILPFVSGNLLASTGYSTLSLRTDKISISEHLQLVDESLRRYESWKVLGNYYIIRYLSYILPKSVARFILQRIFKQYPMTFSKINLQAPSSIQLPHIPLWSHTVDEFCFWNLPQSDFSVSITLINYAENLRFHVLSPMKSLDTVLTKKLNRYLNLIAEKVGVDKTLIPYSRRNSPAQSSNSTNCSSPQILRTTNNNNIIISSKTNKEECDSTMS